MENYACLEVAIGNFEALVAILADDRDDPSERIELVGRLARRIRGRRLRRRGGFVGSLSNFGHSYSSILTRSIKMRVRI
jgi:hypothetical protein